MSYHNPASRTSGRPTAIRRLLWSLPAGIALILLTLWMLGVVWGSGYAILDYRNALGYGYASADTLYLSAYAAMLQTYGVPSTGLDGLPVVPYHFGANWFAGELARLLGVSTFTVYNHVLPILLPILFVASFLWLIAGLHPHKGWQRSILFWGVFVAGIVRILPQAIGETMGMTAFSFISESNDLAFILIFATAGLLVRGAYRQRWFLWPILPLLCLVIGLTKQSAIYLLVAALAALFVSYRLFRRWDYWIAALLVALVCIPSYLVSRGYYAGASVAPFDYLTSIVHSSPLIWLACNFGWSWLYIGLRLRERKPPYADVIVVATLCFAGMIPTLLLRIPDGSGAYFIDLQRLVAVALLLAWLPTHPRFRRWQQVALAGAAVVVIGNVLISTLYFVNWQSVIPPTESDVVDQLEQIAMTDDKAHTALYIPRDHPYWSLIAPDGRGCSPVGFVAPALTGMALIDGVPDARCQDVQGYGYSAYTEAPVEMCVRAREYGFTRILILDSLTSSTPLECD